MTPACCASLSVGKDTAGTHTVRRPMATGDKRRAPANTRTPGNAASIVVAIRGAGDAGHVTDNSRITARRRLRRRALPAHAFANATMMMNAATVLLTTSRTRRSRCSPWPSRVTITAMYGGRSSTGEARRTRSVRDTECGEMLSSDVTIGSTSAAFQSRSRDAARRTRNRPETTATAHVTTPWTVNVTSHAATAVAAVSRTEMIVTVVNPLSRGPAAPAAEGGQGVLRHPAAVPRHRHRGHQATRHATETAARACSEGVRPTRAGD